MSASCDCVSPAALRCSVRCVTSFKPSSQSDNTHEKAIGSAGEGTHGWEHRFYGYPILGDEQPEHQIQDPGYGKTEPIGTVRVVPGTFVPCAFDVFFARDSLGVKIDFADRRAKHLEIFTRIPFISRT